MIDTGQYDARVQPKSSKEQQEQVFANHRQRVKQLSAAAIEDNNNELE